MMNKIKKVKESIKDFIGGVLALIFDNKILTSLMFLSLAVIIVGLFLRGCYFYGMHLDNLERTYETVSSFQFDMYMCDISAIFVFMFGIYMFDLYLYFNHKLHIL